MDWLKELFNASAGGIIVAFLLGLAIAIIVVYFWTWIITNMALAIVEKNKKEQGTPELSCLREIATLLNEQSTQLSKISLALQNIKTEDKDVE